MNKIHISHWNGGVSHKNFKSTEIIETLIGSFIKTIRKKNPNLEIVFITDTITTKNLDENLLSELTVINELDKYNDLPDYKWALVKMLAMNSITDDKFMHIDYDIMWDYDLSNVFKFLEQSNIDALYQHFESLNLSYYLSSIRRNYELKVLISSLPNKFAYNAGIVYVNEKAKKKFDLILSTVKTDYDCFHDYISLEQLIMPTHLKKYGLNVDVLGNIFRELSFIENGFPYDKLEKPVNAAEYLNDCGIFLDSIGFHHLIGDLKTSDWSIDFMSKISKEY